jgi:hypothetical protein
MIIDGEHVCVMDETTMTDGQVLESLIMTAAVPFRLVPDIYKYNISASPTSPPPFYNMCVYGLFLIVICFDPQCYDQRRKVMLGRTQSHAFHVERPTSSRKLVIGFAHLEGHMDDKQLARYNAVRDACNLCLFLGVVARK